MGEDFDAVVTVVRAWRSGGVELELRGIGGPNDGKSRTKRLSAAEAKPLLVELARLLAEVATP